MTDYRRRRRTLCHSGAEINLRSCELISFCECCGFYPRKLLLADDRIVIRSFSDVHNLKEIDHCVLERVNEGRLNDVRRKTIPVTETL